jgi:hypothetical protein
MTSNSSITAGGPIYCGPTEPSAEPSTCPHCQAVTPPGAQSCPGCHLALPGNSLAMKDGKRSRRFQDAVLPGQEQLRAAIAERRIEWAADLGGDLSFSQRDLISRGLRLHVILDTLEANMEREGVLTPKGAMRAATTLYLSVLDRLMKIYLQLGIERKTRHINPLDAVRAAVEEANRQS